METPTFYLIIVIPKKTKKKRAWTYPVIFSHKQEGMDHFMLETKGQKMLRKSKTSLNT